jgi:hypothetical protein
MVTVATPDSTGVAPKFNLLTDLGVLTVKEKYVHSLQLSRFRDKNRKRFAHYDKAIKDHNFYETSRILVSGNRLLVRAFKQVVCGETTSEERLAFLDRQNAVYTGAQGASLVFEEMRLRLPKGYWYASLDRKENLLKDHEGRYNVPGIYASRDGHFEFGLAYFDQGWGDMEAFLGFFDIV